MNKINYNCFASKTELDQQLTSDVANLLSQAIHDNGFAVLCVSGGSTPVNFFQALSQQELDWSKVTVTLADERWVDSNHADSNQKLVQDNLLINKAAKANFIALYNDAVTAKEGETYCNDLMGQVGTFDVLILGMGGDGHTASLFPQAERLDEGISMTSGLHALATNPVTAPHDRMTLTLPRLLNSKKIIVHITGQEKKDVIQKTLTLKDPKQLPIATVLQQDSVPPTVYWA